MPKVILFMKRRKGITHEEFRAAYEGSHARLAEKFFGKFMVDYRRNYIQRDQGVSHRTDGGTDDDYDVITEIWYRTEEDLRGMWAANQEPAIKAELEADGDAFDTDAVRFFVVDEVLRKPG
jgi:hypothetical protein